MSSWRQPIKPSFVVMRTLIPSKQMSKEMTSFSFLSSKNDLEKSKGHTLRYRSSDPVRQYPGPILIVFIENS